MKLIDLFCTQCGASLKIDSSLKRCFCQYCGNQMLIDDEIVKHKLVNGAEFGYQAELGKRKFQEDLANIDARIMQTEKALQRYRKSESDYLLLSFGAVFFTVLLFLGFIGAKSFECFMFGMAGVVVSIIFFVMSKDSKKGIGRVSQQLAQLQAQRYNLMNQR